jgi:hypothetical protein
MEQVNASNNMEKRRERTTTGERVAFGTLSISCGAIWFVLVPVMWIAAPVAAAVTIAGLVTASKME